MMKQSCGDCIFYGANGASPTVCGYFNVNPMPDCVKFDLPEDSFRFEMEEFDGMFCPCFERVESPSKGEGEMN